MKEIDVLEFVVNLLDDDDGIKDTHKESVNNLLDKCVDHTDIANRIKNSIDDGIDEDIIFIYEDEANTIRESINLAKTEEEL